MKVTLDELIAKMNKLKTELPKTEKKILKEMISTAENEISQAVSLDNFIDTEPISVSSNENKVGLTGTQAIYDEFGTGTMGENNPHPDKNEFNLNPYNSGKTIRLNTGITATGNDITEATKQGIKLNDKYWTYRYGDKKIYTQGRPAGAYVYKGYNKIKNEKDKIIDKEVGDMLSKL